MITGNKIILRPLHSNDWDKTLKWRNSMEIKNYAMIHPYPITVDQEKDWYDHILKNITDKIIYFAIDEKQQSKLIGYVFLKNIQWIHRNCTLGIIIGENDSRGKGYGIEALQLIENYAFHTLNLNKISLEVVAYNQAAINLYKKVGYVVEGTLVNQFFSDNQYHNVCIMSLFKK